MNKHRGHIPSHTLILMRGHRSSGGATNTMSGNTPIYKKGGSLHRKHRSHHAEGDLTGINPITGTKSPDILEKKRGGPAYRRNRACHAEGDVVATPYRRGGKTHPHRKHHAAGDIESLTRRPLFGMDDKYARKGGSMHHKHRKHHAEGDLEKMSHGGRKKKAIRRQHRDFGGFINDALNAAGMIAPFLPLILKEGGPAKLAAGGVGKIRRGMMSKSGKILGYPIHARMNSLR